MHFFSHRFLWLLMALHLLNCSVDAPDVSSNWTPEDLGYNEQESVVEILLEQVADLGDVIAEYDDDDSGDETSGKKTAVDYFVVPTHLLADVTALFVLRGPIASRPESRPEFISRAYSPPPEA